MAMKHTVDLRGIHYRVLYFFHGHAAIVVSHGVVKSQKVPGAAGGLDKPRGGMDKLVWPFADSPVQFSFRDGQTGLSMAPSASAKKHFCAQPGTAHL